MLLLALSLLPLLFSATSLADVRKALDCRVPSPTDQSIETCLQPIDDVVAVVSGSSYVAKVECKDCPYAQRTERGGHTILKSDQILVSRQNSILIPQHHD